MTAIGLRTGLVRGGLIGSCLALQACAILGKNDSAVAATPSPEQMRIASLETELAAAHARNIELEGKLAEAAKRERAQELAAAPAPAVEAPTLKEGIETAVASAEPTVLQQPAEIRPETVIADADADKALASAPAKPVEAAPRLVQPTFASQETVFENEASDGIKTTSVLFGVHLASYRHAEEARAGWVKLQRDYPDELGLLEPRLEKVDIEGRGVFLRLIGGGFASEEKASALCATLKAHGAYCAVAGFEGERLSFVDGKSG